MAGTQIATISHQEWPMVMQQADMLVRTKFLPAAIDTKEKAIAVMMKGRELGIPPMYALSNIAVISGKPTCTAELMLALIYRDHGDDAVMFTEVSATKATISYKRRGWKERQTFSFSIEDARTAGLSGGNWAKYPAAMLRARCTSAVGRMGFPDTIAGMYTPEELGAAVDAETGEIISAPAAPVREPGTATRGAARVDVDLVLVPEASAEDQERDDCLAWIDKALKELHRRKPEVDVATLGQIGDGSTLSQIKEYGRRLKEALA